MGFKTLPGRIMGFGLLSAFMLAFALFRATDIVELCLHHGQLATLGTLAAVVALTNLVGANVALPICCALIGLYVDGKMLAPIPEGAALPAGSAVIVTGANSGVGLASAQALAQLGTSLTLILGCRSMARCEVAAAEVRAGAPAATVIPLILDLASAASIRTFAAAAAERLAATELSGKLVLLNNAGFAPTVESPPTEDGLEAAMGAMHVGHHYLTRRLLVSEGLRAKARGGVRVVNVASVAHHICGLTLLGAKLGLPEAYAPPCLRPALLADRPHPPSRDFEPYPEAKLSNVLHALELPRRFGGADGLPGVEASAIDLGWVETAIQPFMQMRVSPAKLGLMRAAPLGVRPIVLAALGMPGSAPPVPLVGRLITPLGRVVDEPLKAFSTEPQLAALAAPLWAMSERIADEWDASA